MDKTLKMVLVVAAGVVVGGVVLLAVAAAIVLLPALGRARDRARKVRCESNLSQIAKGMHMYLLKFGDNSMYAIPSQTFRGDCWLATLYWTEIIREPKVFYCPGTDDRGTIPATMPADLSTAAAVPADAVSYAGLRKTGTTKSSQLTPAMSEAEIPNSYMMACDDNEGTQNHSDGLCIVYFDAHVEFRPGAKTATYDLIGVADSAYSYLDSGGQ